MIKEIEDEFLCWVNGTTKTGTYPLSVTDAYDYILIYKKDPKNMMRLIGGKKNASSGM